MSKNNDTRYNQHPLVDLLILVAVLICVFVIWGLAASWIDGHIIGNAAANETDAQARGLFGDKFGAVNALFSGFAFAAIIFTILLQRRDMAHTRAAFEQQTNSTDQQRFDTTFFNLLRLHNDITTKLSDLGNEGRLAFDSFNIRIMTADSDFPVFSALSKLERDQIRLIRDRRTISSGEFVELSDTDISNISISLSIGTSGCDNYLDENLQMHESKIRQAYTNAATLHIDNYSHYFRNLYHILVFIDSSPLIKEIDRCRYAKIVRSQLSEVELVALFYNSLTKIALPGRESMELGYPKMGKLLVKYDLLQNMSPRSIIHPLHLRIFSFNNGSKE